MTTQPTCRSCGSPWLQPTIGGALACCDCGHIYGQEQRPAPGLHTLHDCCVEVGEQLTPNPPDGAL